MMRSQVRNLLQTALLAVLIFIALQTSVQNYLVDGPSMQPTLRDGQFLVVSKFVYYRLHKARLVRFLPFLDAEAEDIVYLFHAPQHGDVVVFRLPSDPSRSLVKRVIGVPGDTVEIRRGRVYVNDELLGEPYIVNSSGFPLKETWQLSAKDYFVLGDNRSSSNDSRDFGPIPGSNILGKVWISYSPLYEFRFL